MPESPGLGNACEGGSRDGTPTGEVVSKLGRHALQADGRTSNAEASIGSWQSTSPGKLLGLQVLSAGQLIR